jgi:hypothetical protein
MNRFDLKIPRTAIPGKKKKSQITNPEKELLNPFYFLFGLSIQIPRRIKEGPPPPSHALSDQP